MTANRPIQDIKVLTFTTLYGISVVSCPILPSFRLIRHLDLIGGLTPIVYALFATIFGIKS